MSRSGKAGGQCSRCCRKATALAYRDGPWDEPAQAWGEERWELSCDTHTDVEVDEAGGLVTPAPGYWIPLDDSSGPDDNFLRNPLVWLRHLVGRTDWRMLTRLLEFLHAPGNEWLYVQQESGEDEQLGITDVKAVMSQRDAEAKDG